MCEFCNRHLNNGKECGKAYPIQPCASGDLGVRAEYIDGGQLQQLYSQKLLCLEREYP